MAVTDVLVLHREDAIDVGAGKNTTTHEGVDPKEAKAKRGYKTTVKYCKKFIDRDPAQITKKEVMNLKVVKNFRKNRPQLPTYSLLVEKSVVAIETITGDTTTLAAVPTVEADADLAESNPPIKKRRSRKAGKSEPAVAAEAEASSCSALKRDRSTRKRSERSTRKGSYHKWLAKQDGRGSPEHIPGQPSSCGHRQG